MQNPTFITALAIEKLTSIIALIKNVAKKYQSNLKKNNKK